MSVKKVIKKLSTSLHAFFDAVSGNVYFVIVIFNICGQKCDFLQVVKIQYPKNRFLVKLRSLLSTYKFSQGGGGYFLSAHSKKNFLTKKWAL